MRGSPFTQGGIAASTTAATVSPLTPETQITMGTTRTIDLNSAAQKVFQGTLDQTSCAITFTGFAAAKYSELLVQLVCSSGKTVTFTDTITWDTGYSPVIPSSGIVEFVISSMDGTNLAGAHGQPIHVISWGPGNAGTAVSSVSSPRIPIPWDARVIGGIARLVTAGTVQSTIVDCNKNGSTLYSTQANRPTLAISGTSSGSITLPDTTALAAGDYVTFDVDQFGTNAAGLTIALFVLAAA